MRRNHKTYMDYLDPQKKRRKRARIMIGYGLLGLMIAMATVVLVYVTSGFDVDRSTGQVIQNGLIYVDSKPESAKIFLNGVEQGNRTDARLILPDGQHDIRLERDGYRKWRRMVDLDGGSVRRINYARLVPTDLETAPALTLTEEPDVVTQSVDKRWLVMAFNGNALDMSVIDLESAQLTPEKIEFPVDMIKTKESGKWEVIEWADDHKTFLATYTSDDGVEYLLINRDRPLESVNVSDVVGDVKYDTVSMRNRKKDLLFVHDSSTDILTRTRVNGTNPEVVARDVLAYTSFGEDVLYVTPDENDTKMVTAVLQRGDDISTIRQIPKANEYLLDLSKIGNAFVVGVASTAEDKIYVYHDPIAAINRTAFSNLPVPSAVLRLDKPEEMRISTDSSAIVVRGGQSFVSHEFEEDRSYKFTIDETSSYDKNQEFRWLDGRHFTYSADGTQYMIDYNGDNRYTLVPSLPRLGGFFDKDLDFFFTFSAERDEDRPSQMSRTFMRTLEDR